MHIIIKMINILNFFQRLFCSDLIKRNRELEELFERYLPSFRFKSTMSVQGDELASALRKAFPTLKTLKIADSVYDMVKKDELVEWLNEDSLSDMCWLETVNDCDDFAIESTCRIKILSRIQIKNIAYGEAWGNTPMGYHAFCVAYVLKGDDKKVIVVEPQNDDTQGWKKSDYKPDFIKI